MDRTNEGIRYTPVGAGIRIDDSTGTSEILITQIKSDSVSQPPVNQKPVLRAALVNAQVDEDRVLVWMPGGALTDCEYYESNSTLRNIYDGKLPKMLAKLAGNDDFWKVAV